MTGPVAAANQHISVNEIIAIAAEQAGIKPADITGKRRIRRLVKVRFRAMAVARMIRQDKSLPLLGRIFGGRDHSTVDHALAKQYVRVHTDPQEAAATEALWRAAMLQAFNRHIAAMEEVLAVQRQQEEALAHAARLAAEMEGQLQ